MPECRRSERQLGQDAEGLGHLVAGHVQVAVISPSPPPDAGGVVRIWRVERRGWGGTTGVPSSSLAAHFHLTVGNDLTTDLYFSLMMSRRPRFRYRISNLARPGILTTT